MARTALTPQVPTAAGITPTYSAANVDGHSFRNSGRSILLVKNGSGASINVTVETPGTADGLNLPDMVVAVPAAAERMISLRNINLYKQANGDTNINFSAVTSVTVGLFEGGAA